MPRRRQAGSPPLPLFHAPAVPAAWDVTVHTDGACSGNPGPGGWAAILETADAFEEIGGREEQTTNNRMEMRAAIEGLRSIRPPLRVRVVTDSRYLHDGITRWVHAWKRRGWKKADGEAVLNQDLWEEVDGLVAALGRRAVTWEHVRGHAGHPQNERCDAIATAFARGGQPELRRGPCPWAPTKGIDEALAEQSDSFPVYLSLVDGVMAEHPTWGECEARVRGIRGALHRKVRSSTERCEVLEAWGYGGG